MKVELNRFQRRICLKMLTDDGLMASLTMDGRRDDGRQRHW